MQEVWHVHPCDLFAVCHDLSGTVCQVFIAKMGWDAFGKADFETFQKAVAPWNYFMLAWGCCNPHSWVVHAVLQLHESWVKVDGNGEHVLLQDIRNYMAGQMPPEFLENRMEHFFSDLDNHLGNPVQVINPFSSLKPTLLCIFHAKHASFSCLNGVESALSILSWIEINMEWKAFIRREPGDTSSQNLGDWDHCTWPTCSGT